MYKKKTKEQLKEAKKARENLTSILANIKVGESILVEKMTKELISDRTIKYRKATKIDIGLTYEETENGVIIFRRK